MCAKILVTKLLIGIVVWNLVKSNETYCYSYHAVWRGNQHGDCEYDDLPNWIDINIDIWKPSIYGVFTWLLAEREREIAAITNQSLLWVNICATRSWNNPHVIDHTESIHLSSQCVSDFTWDHTTDSWLVWIMIAPMHGENCYYFTSCTLDQFTFWPCLETLNQLGS